jgi:hypothetical protein
MRRAVGASATLALLLLTVPARAIRPFITDDAHTVGKGHVQLETYWRRDRSSLQHWVLPAIGPNEWLELTLGGVHGVALKQYPNDPKYAIAGPLLQGKFLLRDAVPNKPPGVGIVVGGVSPVGTDAFRPPGWSGFSYLAVTQSFIKEDDLLFHGNVGISAVDAPGLPPARMTWGVGFQAEAVFDFHLIGEVFSGDPYVVTSGGAYQTGFRIIFNDHLQLDGTVGGGMWGETKMPVWFSSGLRIVSHELW